MALRGGGAGRRRGCRGRPGGVAGKPPLLRRLQQGQAVPRAGGGRRQVAPWQRLVLVRPPRTRGGCSRGPHQDWPSEAAGARTYACWTVEGGVATWTPAPPVWHGGRPRLGRKRCTPLARPVAVAVLREGQVGLQRAARNGRHAARPVRPSGWAMVHRRRRPAAFCSSLPWPSYAVRVGRAGWSADTQPGAGPGRLAPGSGQGRKVPTSRHQQGSSSRAAATGCSGCLLRGRHRPQQVGGRVG